MILPEHCSTSIPFPLNRPYTGRCGSSVPVGLSREPVSFPVCLWCLFKELFIRYVSPLLGGLA